LTETQQNNRQELQITLQEVIDMINITTYEKTRGDDVRYEETMLENVRHKKTITEDDLQ